MVTVWWRYTDRCRLYANDIQSSLWGFILLTFDMKPSGFGLVFKLCYIFVFVTYKGYYSYFVEMKYDYESQYLQNNNEYKIKHTVIYIC